ncbi:HET-domain-containing protein, partial [Polychaeton citri CBS 116435]
IRLITLYRGYDDDPIEVSLRTTDAVSDKGYDALSYTWGDAKDTKCVWVDRRFVRVTRNLYIFLRELRKPNEDLRLWADALCINQKDDDEKSAQVGLMPDIYPRANKVICWLG